MPWPVSQDYNEAIQNPTSCFNDPALRQATARCNAIGLPMPCSGNFADVYQLTGADGKKWAVKCFTRQVQGLRERYSAISRYLTQVDLPFMVDFTYLDPGIKVQGFWYPVLKMDWVEGVALNDFAKQNADQPATLDALCRIWVKLARRLRKANIAHADLQHGNVLLVPSKRDGALSVRLIDYDGMWVPALAQSKSGEVGHPAYQHPWRLHDGTYNSEVDRFPHLVIYAALRALIVGRRYLWNKYDNGDNLLFRQQDLAEPTRSSLVRELLQWDDTEVCRLVDQLSQAAEMPLEQTPLLEQIAGDAHAMRLKNGSVPSPDAPSTTLQAEQSATAEVVHLHAAMRLNRVTTVVAGLALVGLCVAGWMLATGRRSKDVAVNVIGVEQPSSAASDDLRPATPTDSTHRTPKDLRLVPMPDLILPAGRTHVLEVRVERRGWGGPIELRMDGLPKFISAEPVTLPASSDLAKIRLTAPVRATPSNQSVTLTATAGDLKVKATFQLTVRSAPYLRLLPLEDVVLRPGESRELQVGVDCDALHGSVELTIQGLPNKVLPGPPTVLTRAQKEARLPLTATYDAPEVTKEISVIARQGDLSATRRLTLDVGELKRFESRSADPTVNCLCYSPDGTWLATGADDHLVTVWNASTGQDALLLRGHTSEIIGLCYSPNSQRLASSGRYDGVKIWDGRSGRELLALGAQGARIFRLWFSPDGSQLITVGLDNSINVWDAHNGQNLASLALPLFDCFKACPSPVDDRIASRSSDRIIKVWDTRTRQETLSFAAHSDGISDICWSPDGQRLAASSADRTVRVWDAITGKDLLTLQGHSGFIFKVCFSPDGKQLVSASHENIVKIWDTQTGKELQTLKAAHGKGCRALVFSPDGRRLATVSESTDVFGGELTVWDVTTGNELLTEPHTSTVRFDPDSRWFATVTTSGQVRIYDAARATHSMTLHGHTFSAIQTAAITSDFRQLATSQGDEIVVTNLKSGKRQTWVPTTAEGPGIRSVAFSHDGNALAGAGGNQFELWDLTTNRSKHHHTFSSYTDITGRRFSPDGKCLAYGTSYGTVRVLDATSGKVLHSLVGHPDVVSMVSYSPDGHLLASASDSVLTLWNARTGKPVRSLHDHGGVSEACFSPDSERLVTSNSRNVIRLWDVRTGKELLSFKGHEGKVTNTGGLCFSPDGQRLVNGGSDGTLNIWDARNGNKVQTLRHATCVRKLLYSPNGTQLACGGDGQITVWDAKTYKRLHLFAGADVACECYSTDSSKLVGTRDRPGKALFGPAPAHTAIVWDALSGKELLVVNLRTSVSSVDITGDGSLLVIGKYNGTASVWNVNSGKELVVLHGAGLGRGISLSERVAGLSGGNVGINGLHGGTGFLGVGGGGQNSVSFSPDGQSVAGVTSREEDASNIFRPRTVAPASIAVWETKSGRERFCVEEPLSDIGDICFSSDGRLIGMAGPFHDAMVFTNGVAWNVQGIHLHGHSDRVRSICFSGPSGQWLATGSDDCNVKIWSTSTGTERLTIKGHTDAVRCVRYSPDNSRVASASQDQTVKVWLASNGKELLTLKGHSASVRYVCFNADGSLLGSCGDDNMAKVWNLKTGQEVASFLMHHRRIMTMAFSPDSKHLALVCDDNALRWRRLP